MTNGVKALFASGSSGDPDAMIFGITTASSPQTFTLPCGNAGVYAAEIDWGDDSTSTITTYNDADLAHSYTTAGDYTITITGTLPYIYFNDGGDKLLVKNISQWGDLGFVSCERSFYGCANLTATAVDAPGTSAVTNFGYMFRGCTSLNQSLDSWDVSSGTSFVLMFHSCSNFNQSLNSWDVSGGTSFVYMFYNCSAFNQSLNSWNVSSSTSFAYMFSGCSAMNGDLSSWVVTSSTNFAHMFNGCSAMNIDVSSWNVSSGTDFSYMFYNCSNFNQALSGWDVSSCTSFVVTFRGCTSFNQDLSAWDWDSITNAASMWGTGGGAAMTAANADNFYLGIYNSRNAVPWATPTMDTTPMATPTGTYQYAATPSTGQEYIYALENDDDAEGFNTWTITP